MKKNYLIICIVAFSILLTSCNVSTATVVTTMVPQIGQMRSICELAVMECHFNNVAKYYEEDAQGILLWKKDKQFWVEYSGTLNLGVDVSKVDMTVKDDVVTITLPPAQVLSSKVDENTLTNDSFIVANGSASIEAIDQVNALAEAQDKIEEQVSKNKTLLANAQQRAQFLLEDYVNNIGELMGVNYHIEWIYL